MSEPILLTKLFVPPVRIDLVTRHRLIERLNQSLISDCKLTLISAPAGFGKSTLVCDWLASSAIPAAWLSLDERDSETGRFLNYLIAALQKIRPEFGKNLQAILESSQPFQFESVLTTLINELSAIDTKFLVILDDYHTVDSLQMDQVLEFLIDYQPAQMHLMLVTREDPDLPLARLRARNQLVELREEDLRFSPAEAAEFLNHRMGLNLSEQDIDALEMRTEGWIAGLQMAAISLKDVEDTGSFIQSFTGSHRFVLDYLLEEVLNLH